MNSRPKRIHLSWRSAFAGCCLGVLAPPTAAMAQNIVIIVNEEHITSDDVTQRQLFLAVTSGLGEKMKALLRAPETQSQWREYLQKHRPQSKEQAQALQKEFVGQIQQRAISGASASMRDEAIDQLIEERLMLQAAKREKIFVGDAEVDEAMLRMAQSRVQNQSLEDFQNQFKAFGIDPATLKQRVRAQTAWRQVIRRSLAYFADPDKAQLYSREHLKELKDRAKMRFPN